MSFRSKISIFIMFTCNSYMNYSFSNISYIRIVYKTELSHKSIRDIYSSLTHFGLYNSIWKISSRGIYITIRSCH